MKGQLFYVVVALHIIICAGSDLVVTPSSHQFIAINCTDNVTFTCDATGGDTTSTREAVWEVQDRQIQNDEDSALRRAFEEIGIFLSVIQNGVTEVIITSGARNWYLTQSPPIYNITVMCSSFTDERSPLLEVGDVLNVTTFGVPLIPTALNLDPNPDDLTRLIFSWVIPADAMAGVNLTYTPAITGPSFNISDTTIDNVIVFTDDASLDCQLHDFSVFASNEAGRGPTSSITETIPISPDITDLSKGFQITQVSLGDIVTITFSFPLAQSCSQRFPILNYTLSISSVRYQLDFNAEQDEDPLVRSLDLSDIERDGVFEVFIETCISIACRQSKTLELRTVDLQAASITFFENNIFVTCTFASDSTASGCAIQLVLVNTTEVFVVFQSVTNNVSLCNQTMNQRDAYISISAGDFENNGDLGTELILLEPLVLTDADSYTSWTGCDIPQPVTLSTGAIAGIVAGVVIAVLIVGAVVLALVVVVLVYRVRTGHWFKFTEMDDDQKLTVHFEKELLMGNVKLPRKKSKVSALFSAGKESPDGQQQESIVLADGEAVENDHKKPGIEEQDAGTALNPESAFTLDISSDRKKVKLHLNRALIRRALKEKNLDTMQRKKTVRQNSMCKQHLLPLQCEVRVEVEEEQN